MSILKDLHIKKLFITTVIPNKVGCLFIKYYQWKYYHCIGKEITSRLTNKNNAVSVLPTHSIPLQLH